MQNLYTHSAIKYTTFILLSVLFFGSIPNILNATTNPQTLACDPVLNLVSNPGFETPVITNPQKWDIVPTSNPGLIWNSTDPVYGLEIQAGVAGWLPHTGTQYAEIDGGSYHVVSQQIPTVVGNTYTLSFWTSPRPDVTLSTSTMNVYVNSILRDTLTGPLTSNALLMNQTDWSAHTYTFTATTTLSTIAFADAKAISTGTGMYLDDVSIVCSHANTAPVVTVIGTNPQTVTLGSTFVDLGASATDAEDGNITSHIIASSTVNTAVLGTYAVTYTVVDSSGLTGSATRTVTVVPSVVGSCTATGSNLISNGGFESPVITNPQKWDIIPGTNPSLVWKSADAGYGLEIQAGIFDGVNTWMPHTGTQYAEIDGGFSHVISQDIQTVPGQQYTLSFWTSPRPNQPLSVNSMNVSVDGNIVSTSVASGTPVTVWTQHSYIFIATKSVTTIAFTDTKAISTGTGMYLDDVVVSTCATPVVPPSPMCVLPSTLGDTTVEPIGPSNETTLLNVISNAGLSVSSTTQYQVWHTNKASTTVEIQLINGITAAGDVFGYYMKGQPNTFVPLFSVGSGINTVYPNLPHTTNGQKVTVSVPAGDIGFAIHSSFQGVNSFWVSENSLNTANEDHMLAYDVLSTSTPNYGTYVLAFEDLPFANPNTIPSDRDYNDVVVKVTIASCANPVGVNTPPVITLVGANPLTITVGTVFTDPGATATDLEDGIITNKIIASSTVNANIVGTYSVDYIVTDSGGLSATTTRQVVVVPPVNPPPTGGTVKFCMIYGNANNVVATSSLGLPTGLFAMTLATSTQYASTTAYTHTWNPTAFAPNQHTIVEANDSECVTVSNLPYATYYYSKLATTSAPQWNTPKYNDGFNQPVNSIFDFFAYNATSTNPNADGVLVLNGFSSMQTVYMYATYNPAGLNANLAVTKVVDKTTANVSDLLTYTITVVNNGPSMATSTIVTDVLPSGLTFVSATTTLGSYSTTTGIWTIGSLANGSTTTMTLQATVNSGNEGKTITNTAVATAGTPDLTPNDNTTSATTTVGTPACSANCGGGGGGGCVTNCGGGSGGNGPIVPNTPRNPATTTPPITTPVLGCDYLLEYMRIDLVNNPVEVKKLQVFLNNFESEHLDVSGIFDLATQSAVYRFQDKYQGDILTPWGHDNHTGYVYILTKKKVNEIYCQKAFPVNGQQQTEIDTYRAFLLGLKNAGVDVTTGGTVPTEVTPTTSVPIVGVLDTSSTTPSTNLSTLAGISSTTRSFATGLTANVISSGKRLSNLAMAFVSWPFGFFSRGAQWCTTGYGGWIFWILILIIAILLGMWYREYRKNRANLVIEDLNKEIDLTK